MKVEVSNGELLDKLSILEIKCELIREPDKARNVVREWILLSKLSVPLLAIPEIKELFSQLEVVNRKLWDIEDAIRVKELDQEFDDTFVKLARSVYKTNAVRTELKHLINKVSGSLIVEEKEYKGK
jgi:hypothetical protein